MLLSQKYAALYLLRVRKGCVCIFFFFLAVEKKKKFLGS